MISAFPHCFNAWVCRSRDSFRPTYQAQRIIMAVRMSEQAFDRSGFPVRLVQTLSPLLTCLLQFKPRPASLPHEFYAFRLLFPRHSRLLLVKLFRMIKVSPGRARKAPNCADCLCPCSSASLWASPWRSVSFRSVSCGTRHMRGRRTISSARGGSHRASYKMPPSPIRPDGNICPFFWGASGDFWPIIGWHSAGWGCI